MWCFYQKRGRVLLVALIIVVLPSFCVLKPVVDPGLFMILGVETCRNGSGYCLLGLDCTLDDDFLPDDTNGHCDGLKRAFTPSAHFTCCRENPNPPATPPPKRKRPVQPTVEHTTPSNIEEEQNEDNLSIFLTTEEGLDKYENSSLSTVIDGGLATGQQNNELSLATVTDSVGGEVNKYLNLSFTTPTIEGLNNNKFSVHTTEHEKNVLENISLTTADNLLATNPDNIQLETTFSTDQAVFIDASNQVFKEVTAPVLAETTQIY